MIFWIVAILMTVATPASSAKNDHLQIDAIDSLQVPSPLFIDPNYHGSCDPEIIFNDMDSLWYIYYTARRPAFENTWLKTPVGVISSSDLVNWQFRGYCHFDGEGGQPDEDETFWAPAILLHDGILHMFVTYKPDTLPDRGAWGGHGKIVHYQCPADDPVQGWVKVRDMHGDSLYSIDAAAYSLDQEFRIWFKARKSTERKNQLLQFVSHDLRNWQPEPLIESDVFNKSASGYGFEEAPFVFRWEKQYWLITDPHDGLLVYNSPDGRAWTLQGNILREGGQRYLDNTMARHCSVAIHDGRAFLVYHVEPWRRYDLEKLPPSDRVPIFQQPLTNRRSVLQMAEIKWQHGQLTCDRNQIISLKTRSTK